uniref:Uncharacterized protein n=1 Tax=Panagrellus redivivus TaxID=6233 RepID=A0A7E4W2H5_PANRE
MQIPYIWLKKGQQSNRILATSTRKVVAALLESVITMTRHSLLPTAITASLKLTSRLVPSRIFFPSKL